jgi:hypothetical protein
MELPSHAHEAVLETLDRYAERYGTTSQKRAPASSLAIPM